MFLANIMNIFKGEHLEINLYHFLAVYPLPKLKALQQTDTRTPYDKTSDHAGGS